MASGVIVGFDTVGSDSVALLPDGRPAARQSKRSVWARPQPARLSASLATAARFTVSPGFGAVGLAVAEVMVGVAEPQLVVLKVTNFGGDCRPVESVATTEN